MPRPKLDRDGDVEGFDSVGFGMELRRLRRGKGLTVRQVAAAIGLSSPAVVWRMEWGMRPRVPGPGRLRKLAELLETTEARLLQAAGFRVGEPEG